MIELVCIVCPNGCVLSVDDSGKDLIVKGAKCKKGEAFAKEELISPKRTLCSTMKTTFKEIPVIPVRTESEIPKSMIKEAMKVINSITLDKKYIRGAVVIPNILNTGVNIITTSDMTRY